VAAADAGARRDRGGARRDVRRARPDRLRRDDHLRELHVGGRLAPEFAREWVMRSDQRNAELVETTRGRADAVVRIAAT
jgi:hypothetical protein